MAWKHSNIGAPGIARKAASDIQMHFGRNMGPKKMVRNPTGTISPDNKSVTPYQETGKFDNSLAGPQYNAND